MQDGPYFPTSEANYQKDYSHPGISIRLEIASRAMQGLLAGDCDDGGAGIRYFNSGELLVDTLVSDAIAVTDALIARESETRK